MELSDIEYDTFLKLSGNLNSDEATKKLCLQYYLEYKTVLYEEKQQSLSEDKVQIIMRCAFFLSEKSQHMYNLRGEKIRGVSLSLTQTLKSFNNLDEFVFYLKEIIRKIHLEDTELQLEINQFIKKFCFILTFYNKFESVMKKLEWDELPKSGRCQQNKEYIKTLMCFGWLLFIDSKSRLFRNSFQIIDVTCLMVCVFRFLVSMTVDHARCKLFWESDGKNSQKYRQTAQHNLLELFKIRDIRMFESVHTQFQAYINNVLMEFRYHGQDVLSPQNIGVSYKKLDTTYQKTLSDPEDIDERYFLRERVNITPSRFTPFGGRGTSTKWKKQNLNSQRILNYELDETVVIQSGTPAANNKENAQVSNIQMPSNPVTLKFPKHFTPTLTKPPIIFSTPMTQAMQMYNWLAEKPKRQRSSQLFQRVVQKVMAQEKKAVDGRSKDNRRKLIQHLYEDCLATFPLGDEDPGLLCWSMQSVYYILNLPEISMSKMIQIAEIDWYQLWRVTDYFLRYDRNMPNALKMHILDMETRIISMELWKDETDLFSLFNPQQNTKLVKKYADSQRFIRRIIHQIAYQIHLLTQPLNLSQAMTNGILAAVQHILSQHPNLLYQHHLDQLVLCSAYGLSRVMGLHPKFNEIIIKYRQANGYTKEVYNEIIEQVQTDGRKDDIITFYNQTFLPTMKTYMIDFKEKRAAGQAATNPTIQRNPMNLLGSPIKTLIPKELLSLKPNSHMTPQTQMLYAYNESPLLRSDQPTDYRQNTATFLPSKKLLNFDTQLEETSRKKTEKPDSFADIQDATSDFINKKFNLKKKEMVIHPEPTTLMKQTSNSHLKTEDKLMKIKSKQRL